MAESVGQKRAHPESTATTLPHKKRKVRRALHHVQNRPEHIEPAPQDPVFAQGQLMRSITAALVIAGFDSAHPTALEMFRASVEEYMLEFIRLARTNMRGSRRTKPTALDFASAMALMPNTSTASLLVPQLKVHLPDQISCPVIEDPDPAPAPAHDFSSLLQPLIISNMPEYIPRHFPNLPPQHAWKHTSVYPEREHDARRMRERATEEGILAEQALRKLAAAAKTGAVQMEKRRENTLSGQGRKVGMKEGQRPSSKSGADEDMYGDMMREVEGKNAHSESMELGLDGMNELREEGIDPGMPDGVLVNAEIRGWRRGARKHFHF